MEYVSNPSTSRHYKLDEYRISERQKTQGDDMAVEDFEPEKDKRPAHPALNRYDPIARGDRLIACLSQGLRSRR